VARNKEQCQEVTKCQQNKVQHMKKIGKLHSLEILKVLWQEISINIIGPLPESNKKNIIVVIMDWFTKMIRLKTTIITVLLEDIAKIY